MKKIGKVLVLTYDVDPTKGATHLCEAVPEGYVFWKMSRVRTKAKVYFVKKTPS